MRLLLTLILVSLDFRMIAQMIAALMIVILGSCPSNSDAQPVAPMLPAGSGDSTNFLRWVNNLNYPPSVEWRSPRLWLSPTFGMAPYFGPRPLAKVDDWVNHKTPTASSLLIRITILEDT